MPAFSPNIGRFSNVTARGKPWTLWYKKHRGVARIGAMAIVIVMLVVGGWFYWQSQYVAAAGGVYQEGMVGQPVHLNPLFSNDNPVDAELTPLIFRGLLKYDAEQRLQPDLAQSIDISEDGKVYTLKMAQAYWHDGQSVTARDAAFTIKTTQHPDYTGPLSRSFTNVEVAVSQDDQTLTLTLKESYAPFAQSLTLGLLPEHLLKDVPVNQLAMDRFNLAPVGTGQLKFQSLQLTDDEESIAQIRFQPLEGYLESIAFLFYPDITSAINDFRLGELQAIGSNYSAEIDVLESFPGKRQASITLGGQSYGLFFNLQSQYSKDHGLRQSLAYSIDKDQLIRRVLDNRAARLNGPYAQTSEYFSDRAEIYDYDQAKAQELFDAVSEKPTQLTLLIPEKTQLRAVADQIRQDWQALGISTSIIERSGEALNTMLNQHQGYDVVLLGEKFEPDPDRYSTWHSTQIAPNGLNITSLENKRVDKALEDGRRTINYEERKAAYDSFQLYLAKDAPAIWLYQPQYVYVWSNKVQGIEVDYLWTESDRFANLHKWYMKTQRRD